TGDRGRWGREPVSGEECPCRVLTGPRRPATLGRSCPEHPTPGVSGPLMPTHTGVLVALALISPFASAAEGPRTYPLWPEGAPGALGKETGDENHAGDVPTITVFRPEAARANGASVVVCPGGGYGFLATEHEGKDVADWLNSLG